MNTCAHCGQTHADGAEACPPGPPSPEIMAGAGWLRRVIIPTVVWGVINLLAMYGLGVGVEKAVALVLAVWAASDSAKLQPRGARVLGIAFRPIVVFSVVAFFLWGFGFVWYLVMRHRVITTPAQPPGKDALAPPEETWACKQCAEANPSGFDSCWNCRTARSVDMLVPENTDTAPPALPRGGNPWE